MDMDYFGHKAGGDGASLDSSLFSQSREAPKETPAKQQGEIGLILDKKKSLVVFVMDDNPILSIEGKNNVRSLIKGLLTCLQKMGEK